MALSRDYLEKEFETLLMEPGALAFLEKTLCDGFWYWDLEDTRNEWVSPGFWRALGYAALPLSDPKPRWFDLLFPQDRELVFENVRRHCEQAAHPFDQILRFRGAHGNTVTMRCRGMAIRRNGKPVRMLGGQTVVHSARGRDLDRQLSELIELSGDAVMAWSLRRGIQRWNRGAVSLYGFSGSEAFGQDPNELTRASYPQGWDEVAACLEGGEPWSGEVERRRADGSTLYTSARLSPIELSSDDVLILEIDRDITETYRTQESLRMANRELNHRVKNLFAIVQGLVSVSGRGESDPAVLTDKIQARIAALAAAHMISIDEEEVRTVTFRQILDAILAPYDQRRDQLTTAGLDARLPKRAVTPVGMIFHELATNAVKYGAWSQPDGQLTITWMTDDFAAGGPVLHVRWSEQFARSAEGIPEGRSGLGLPLIQQSAKQLDGELTRSWLVDGMETTLSFSLAETVGASGIRSVGSSVRNELVNPGVRGLN